MNQNNGLEAKIFREETRSTLTMDLSKIASQLIRIPLPDQTPLVETTVRIMQDFVINAETDHSIETLENCLEKDLSTIRVETGETLEIFLVLHRFKGETSLKIVRTANQEVINLTILLSADLTIDLRLVSHLTNKNFHKTITRRHPMWSTSPQPAIPIMN